MASPKTIARLEAQIQRRIAHCLQFELADPCIGFITVTRVELSTDIATAKVHYSVLGDEKQVRLAGATLERAGGFVQRQVASVLRTRTVPRLVWVFDESIREAARMDQIIRAALDKDEELRANAPKSEAPEGEPQPDDPEH